MMKELNFWISKCWTLWFHGDQEGFVAEANQSGGQQLKAA
jgi:hypothetical protein